MRAARPSRTSRRCSCDRDSAFTCVERKERTNKKVDVRREEGSELSPSPINADAESRQSGSEERERGDCTFSADVTLRAISTRTGVMGVLSIELKARLLILTTLTRLQPHSLLLDDRNLGDSASWRYPSPSNTAEIVWSAVKRWLFLFSIWLLGVRPFPPLLNSRSQLVD